MRLIVVCGLPGSTIFFHIIKQAALLKKVFEHGIYILISSTNLSEIFLILTNGEVEQGIEMFGGVLEWRPRATPGCNAIEEERRRISHSQEN
jgi:hypothetical protein